MQNFAQEVLVLDNSPPPHSLLGGDGRIIQKRPPPSLPEISEKHTTARKKQKAL